MVRRVRASRLRLRRFLRVPRCALAFFLQFQGNNGTISRVTTDATHPFPDAAPPVLRAIAPKAGPKEGGTTLTITGSGFRRSKNLKVRFLSERAGPRVLNRADEA